MNPFDRRGTPNRTKSYIKAPDIEVVSFLLQSIHQVSDDRRRTDGKMDGSSVRGCAGSERQRQQLQRRHRRQRMGRVDHAQAPGLITGSLGLIAAALVSQWRARVRCPSADAARPAPSHAYQPPGSRRSTWPKRCTGDGVLPGLAARSCPPAGRDRRSADSDRRRWRDHGGAWAGLLWRGLLAGRHLAHRQVREPEHDHGGDERERGRSDPAARTAAAGRRGGVRRVVGAGGASRRLGGASRRLGPAGRGLASRGRRSSYRQRPRADREEPQAPGPISAGISQNQSIEPWISHTTAAACAAATTTRREPRAAAPGADRGGERRRRGTPRTARSRRSRCARAAASPGCAVHVGSSPVRRRGT